MDITLLVVPAELAKLLGTSKQRVYRLIREGQLPAPQRFNDGRLAYLLPDALDIAARRRVDHMARGRQPAKVIVGA